MKVRLILLLVCFFQVIAAQPSHLSLQWDSLTKHHSIWNAQTHTRTEITVPFQYEHTGWWRNGFWEIKTGDMRALYTPEGKELLGPSHFIYFSGTPRLIHAYVCVPKTWVILTEEGDTVNWGVAPRHSYCPETSQDLNLAGVQLDRQIRWGYLNRKGNWAIPPIFEEAEAFVGGLARVKKEGSWAVINEQGTLVPPSLLPPE